MSLHFCGSFSESPPSQSGKAKDEKQKGTGLRDWVTSQSARISHRDHSQSSRSRPPDNSQRFNAIVKAELCRLIGAEAAEGKAESVPAGDGVCREEIPGVAFMGSKVQEIKLERASGEGRVAVDVEHAKLPGATTADLEQRGPAASKRAVDRERAKRIARSDGSSAPDGHVSGDRTGATKSPTINDDGGLRHSAVVNGLTSSLDVGAGAAD